MTDSSSKLLQIQGKWYQERKQKKPKNYSEPLLPIWLVDLPIRHRDFPVRYVSLPRKATMPMPAMGGDDDNNMMNMANPANPDATKLQRLCMGK
jgi:hypothetical protein